jgi:hypothetical protein
MVKRNESAAKGVTGVVIEKNHLRDRIQLEIDET